MSALACFSSEYHGILVSGSDRSESDVTRRLRASGISVVTPHSGDAVMPDTSLVVRSLAVADTVPEICRARELGIPVVDRPAYLGALMRPFDERIGVMGTHGKSTVTAMTDTILAAAGFDPSTVSGADLTTRRAYRVGGKRFFVYEACEYRRAFLSFYPTVSILTNIELDHTDCYPSESAIGDAFYEALCRTEKVVVFPAADPIAGRICKRLPIRAVSVGGEGCEAVVRVLNETGGFYSFSLDFCGKSQIFNLGTPGAHQVANAALAATCTALLGVPLSTAASAIAAFRGIGSRIEPIGEWGRCQIYRDYAHHPTEIRAGIDTLRRMKKEEITVVFCPHTFTRTRDLFPGFCSALALADKTLVLPIYPAREKPIPGVTSEALAAQIPGAKSIKAEEVADALSDLSGTVVLMGAGDFSGVLKKLGFSRGKD